MSFKNILERLALLSVEPFPKEPFGTGSKGAYHADSRQNYQRELHLSETISHNIKNTKYFYVM